MIVFSSTPDLWTWPSKKYSCPEISTLDSGVLQGALLSSFLGLAFRTWKIKRDILNPPLIDPRGHLQPMPVVIIVSAYVRSSVPTFQNIAKQNKISCEDNVHYWWDCEFGRVDHWWHLSYKSPLLLLPTHPSLNNKKTMNSVNLKSLFVTTYTWMPVHSELRIK